MSDNKAGLGTAGKRLKSAWRKAGKVVSFRKFVKALVKDAKEGVADAKTWLSSKLGKLDKKQTDARKTHNKLVSSATKASRKPKPTAGKK